MNTFGSDSSIRDLRNETDTYSLELGFSLNSIDTSPNGDLVVVAGREVFKLVDVKELCKLREHANLRLNTKQSNLFHISDVKWNQQLPNKIVTATWNAQVVLWDIQKKGSKFQVAYDEHKRTVNKVCWAPQQPNVLVSGAQDGLIKLWDIRQSASAATFYYATQGSQQADAVRDVSFSLHSSDVFAAGMDSGGVNVWDIRTSRTMPMQCINAHNNAPVRSLAWHPVQKELLASGSRDETLMVWDLNHLDHGSRFSIQTTAAISVLSWRPILPGQDNTTELATVGSTTHDLCIHVFDLFRPHLPIFSLKGHTREVTGMAWWKQSPNILLSVSKDGTLRAGEFREPNISKVPGTCLAWSVDGTLAAVADKVDRTSLTSGSQHLSLSEWQRDPAQRAIPHPPDVRGAVVMVQELFTDEMVEQALDPFIILAQGYHLHPSPAETVTQICTHNASIALEIQQEHLHEIWLLLALWYQSDSPSDSGTLPDGKSACRFPPSRSGVLPSLSSCLPREEPSNGWVQIDGLAESTSPSQSCIVRRMQPQLHYVDEFEDPPSFSSPVPIREAMHELLEQCCEEGDVQTCCSVMMVLGNHLVSLQLDVDRATSWFLAYIDLLHQRQLFVIASDIIKHCPYSKVASISTRGTNVSVACAGCGSELHSNQGRCPRCARRVYICVICHQEVHGCMIWNWTCGHGGHSEHMEDWFKKHRHCPKCGADAFH